MAPRRRGCRPEVCDTGDIFGAGAQAALLAAAADQRLREMDIFIAADKGANALRSTDLVSREPDQVGAKRADLAIATPRTLHRVDTEQAAGRVHDRRCLRHRLHDPGLVVGEHERDQRPGCPPDGLCHRRQIGPAVPRDRNILDCTTREAAARPHRGILDRRHHELVARVLSPAVSIPGVSASERRCWRPTVRQCRAIAELFLDEGTKVVVPDRNAVPANAALTALGQRAKFYLLDFIREDGITVTRYRAGGRCWDCTTATSEAGFGRETAWVAPPEPLLLATRRVLIEQQQGRQLPPRFDQIGERVRLQLRNERFGRIA